MSHTIIDFLQSKKRHKGQEQQIDDRQTHIGGGIRPNIAHGRGRKATSTSQPPARITNAMT